MSWVSYQFENVLLSGVGRTGCFVAIELAAHMAATKANFKMETVLKEIRDQRMHSIQNDVVSY